MRFYIEFNADWRGRNCATVLDSLLPKEDRVVAREIKNISIAEDFCNYLNNIEIIKKSKNTINTRDADA